ncbi:RIP metalloprotease RseP [Microvirga sp. BT688]|uniref:RIP metalloprotease RseP n=1 Tax=Microvirga sp. TaxID=1873136 RepID=UPI001682911C|nr:RIP metalloprotease RseP [Microvirga sp.]MBD2745724.1 RIP metalloprotease RseP [Microvirga sp.]
MLPFLESMVSALLSLPLILASFVFVLGIVVAVHEYGHLAVARAFGIKAEVYALGFGKCLWSRTDKKGTEWRLCLIPLGGYVKFRGDKNAASLASHEALASMSDSERKASFFHASLLARACTIAAGPLINIAFAVVVFSGIVLYQGQAVLLGRIDKVTEGTPAALAGMKSGDIITAIDRVPMPGAQEIVTTVEQNPSKTMVMTVSRGSESLDFTVTPVMKTRKTTGGLETSPIVGVSFITTAENIGHTRIGVLDAAQHGISITYKVAELTVATLHKIVTGQEGVENLSGPVRIAAISGDFAESQGLFGLVQLIGVISVSIGLMNLLPIPALDGGHLLLFAYEAVAGRRPNKTVEQFSFGVGLACVLSLMVFTTFNDIAQLAFR